MEKPAVQVTDVIGNTINLTSKAQTKDEVLQELCHMLKQNGTVSDERLFYQDVLKRGKLVLQAWKMALRFLAVSQMPQIKLLLLY